MYGGTGLGLSISQRLVEMMGGRLRVESEVGVGSEFHFQLKLPVAQVRTRARREVGATLKGHRFLVVDDNETARHIVSKVLGADGAVVDQAADVDRGLAMMRDAATSSEPYDAVIIDHLMPEKDGFDFAEMVKSGPGEAKVPLLMLTSSPGTGALAQARKSGIAGYLAKPVRGPDLIRALSTVLGREEFDGPDRRIFTKDTLAKGRGLRILALTAHAFAEQRERCREAGMDDFIAKPIQPAMLYATLAKWEERVRGQGQREGNPRRNTGSG